MSSSSSDSSQASIGAVLGCDRVFSAVVRNAVGFKNFFDRAIRSVHPVEKVDFSTGCADRIARSFFLGSKRHFFDSVRKHDLVFDRKSPFSIHRSDCIRIGLKIHFSTDQMQIKLNEKKNLELNNNNHAR